MDRLNKKKSSNGSSVSVDGGSSSSSDGGGRSANGKKKLTKSQARRLIVMVCQKKPNLDKCGEIRRKCQSRQWPDGSDLNYICGELGWSPSSGGGDNPAAMNILVGYQYSAVSEPSKFGAGVEEAWHGVRLSGRSIGVGSLLSLAIDAEISKTGESWYYDLGLMLGAGSWVQKKYGIGAVAGLGTSGISSDTLAQAWQLPAEVFAVAHINAKLTITGFARATWYFEGDEAELAARKRGSSMATFADQFTVGAFAYYGAKSPSWSKQAKYGFHAGVVMRQMQGGSYMGVVLGLGQSQLPRAR